MAVDQTPIQLRDTIAVALKEYVTNPTVTVIVVEATAATAYVMGEVNSPGPQSLNGQMTVLQALATAGGFKDFAKTKDIRIPIDFSYSDLGSAARQLLRSGRFDYRATGSVDVRTSFGARTVPFRKTGTVYLSGNNNDNR